MMLFNDQDVAAVLGKYWDERTADIEIGGDSFGLGAGMDSLTAIDVLLDLESSFELKELPVTLIKRGGYQSRDEFVTLVSENLKRHAAGEAPVCCA
jgi:acyl carrier protein